MSFVILCDSCTDFTEELRERPEIRRIPLTIMVDDYIIIDDDTYDQADFLRRSKASPNCPRSACPSPEAYMRHFEEADEVYMITLSGNLSGSYGSAKVATDIYLEDHPEKKIHVFDSCSASVGQTLTAMKIIEMKDAGASFEDVVEKVTAFVKMKKTKFVLETLDSLRKNGRLTGLEAVIANVLNIKPIMAGTEDGHIVKLDQARGMNKALNVMAKYIAADVTNPAERILGIAHCNNYDRALQTQAAIEKLVQFKSSFIVDTAGVSSLYASDGGIIVAY